MSEEEQPAVLVDKGARVEIVKGRKGKGVTGEVFWIGDDRYNEGGKRVGVSGDDGETYWIRMDYVQETDKAPPEVAAPELSKGDRVIWSQGDEAGEGLVFWTGEGKRGDPRVGVQCDDGETRWFDARRVTLLTDGVDAPSAPAADEPAWSDEEPPF